MNNIDTHYIYTWICVLYIRIYRWDLVHISICNRFLFDVTLDTTRGTNLEHFHTFNEGVLRFHQSQELCSDFGWEAASGISREQFEDLIGDLLVGPAGVQYFWEKKGPVYRRAWCSAGPWLCHLFFGIDFLLDLCRGWEGDKWRRIASDLGEPFQTCSKSVIAE